MRYRVRYQPASVILGRNVELALTATRPIPPAEPEPAPDPEPAPECDPLRVIEIAAGSIFYFTSTKELNIVNISDAEWASDPNTGNFSHPSLRGKIVELDKLDTAIAGGLYFTNVDPGIYTIQMGRLDGSDIVRFNGYEFNEFSLNTDDYAI